MEIQKAVFETNKIQRSGIVGPFEITRGDQVALITNIGANWFSPILHFVECAQTINLRWVTVLGGISEGLASKSSAEMMGPAFVSADKAMKKLKKLGY
ncbi:hypothetical protein EH223_05535 [candidate division KSB1 bacterium]|nr:hypothetical protein [candidate division KSB1 bacterium]RQW05223.1 MAG: hypothetical protein EH223_05535 [candidate division KSB1 bacterium]